MLATAVLDAVSDSHEVVFVDDRILMRMVKGVTAQASPRGDDVEPRVHRGR